MREKQESMTQTVQTLPLINDDKFNSKDLHCFLDSVVKLGMEFECQDKTTKQCTRASPVILLNGFPGVGKLSIGQEIHRIIGSANARFIDNHLLIDPVQAIFPGRGADHKDLRRAIRYVAFTAIKELAPDLAIIMTSCLGSSEEDLEVFLEHLQIAAHRCVPMYLINITCGKDEHLSRFSLPGRSSKGKTKLQDRNTLDVMLQNNTLILPDGDKRPFHMRVDLKAIEYDSSGRSIAESASEIYHEIHRLL